MNLTVRKRFAILVASGVAAAIGLGTLLYFQHQEIEENRAEAERLRREIEAGQALVAKTRPLEREVIVQRETDTVIKQILSNDEDVNNLVRTVNDFARNAGIAVQSIKPANRTNRHGRGKSVEDFGRVAYSIQFEGDAFQLLSFLNQLENHRRFIKVTRFKVSAANRGQIKRGAPPVHKVTLDFETYVYTPKQGVTEARINDYDRKRDELLADIAARSSELRIPSYEYRGTRGRRDPFLDPRVPANVDGAPTLTIEEQMEVVEQLDEIRAEVSDAIDRMDEAENLIAEMKARAALEKSLTRLEGEIRRIDAAGQLVFPTAARRFEEVVAVAEDAKEKLTGAEGGAGPSPTVLQEVTDAMQRHLEAEEYDLALQAYRTIEGRLPLAARDPAKEPMTREIEALATLAKKVLEFEEFPMDIGGVALVGGSRPVALINGLALSAGEYMDLDGRILVSDVRPHEVEFVYDGVALVRRIENDGYGGGKASGHKGKGRKKAAR